MNFLFFDTECATCDHGAKICEFGYVLTDSEFNIIKRDNLTIDPQVRFNLYQLKRAGIELAYSISEYYASPTIAERYEEIKSLLTDPDVLPIGFSCDNDARFFISDFRRNSLEMFDYVFLDVFLLFKQGLRREKGLGLDVIYAETGSEDIPHHQAENDSYMTMKALEYYMRLSGDDINTVLSRRFAFGEVFGGRIIVGGKPFSYNSSGKMTKLNRKMLTDFIAEKTIKEGELSGKKFCFEKNFESENVFSVLKAADVLAEKGGSYTFVLSEADYLVYADKKNRNYLFKKKKRACKVIDLSAFCKMAGVGENELKPENVDVEEILGNLDKNRMWFSRYKKR